MDVFRHRIFDIYAPTSDNYGMTGTSNNWTSRAIVLVHTCFMPQRKPFLLGEAIISIRDWPIWTIFHSWTKAGINTKDTDNEECNLWHYIYFIAWKSILRTIVETTNRSLATHQLICVSVCLCVFLSVLCLYILCLGLYVFWLSVSLSISLVCLPVHLAVENTFYCNYCKH